MLALPRCKPLLSTPRLDGVARAVPCVAHLSAPLSSSLSSSSLSYVTEPPTQQAACVTAYCSDFRSVSSRPATQASREPVSISTKSVGSVLGLAVQCPTQPAVFSPDLHLGGRQRVRVPEYVGPQPSSSRRHRPSETTASLLNPPPPTLHAALAFTPDDAALTCRPPSTRSPCTASS